MNDGNAALSKHPRRARVWNRAGLLRAERPRPLVYRLVRTLSNHQRGKPCALARRSGRRNGAYNQPMRSEPICSVADIRAIETRAADQPLMDRAGLAAAAVARDMLADRRARVLILAGPGNNGGDAFVVARHLASWFFDVVICARDGGTHMPPPAAAARAAWRDCGGATVADWTDDRDFGLIVDGLFGIGLKRVIDEVYARWIAQANDSSIPILALDVPSGLDAETGVAQTPTVRARATATFIALKPGLVTLRWARPLRRDQRTSARHCRWAHSGNGWQSARLGGAAHCIAGRAFARAPQRAQGNLRHAGRRRRQRRNGRRVVAGGACRALPGCRQGSGRPRGDRAAGGRLAAAGADAARRRRGARAAAGCAGHRTRPGHRRSSAPLAATARYGWQRRWCSTPTR